jgi:hypothetical protein
MITDSGSWEPIPSPLRRNAVGRVVKSAAKADSSLRSE